MTHEIVELPAFACLGLEAEGPLDNCAQWLPPLWKRFVGRTGELRRFPYQGVWGLMSDTKVQGAPWGGERGLYLAGWQVPPGTEAFGDWKVWEVRALTWMRIPCRVDQIPQALDHAREALRHHLEWCWEGSVHEFYPRAYHDPQTDDLHLMVGMTPR